MADLIVKVLDKATERDLLTLDEAKLLLGIGGGGESAGDELLKFQISIASETIMTLCDRVFARERVVDTYRGLGRPQVFLSHFPVTEDDIESIELGWHFATLEPDDWELEEETGKLLGLGRFAEPVRVTYTGGYELPEEAPLPLKQACLLMLIQTRSAATKEAIEGVRMIAHKDSRVMFYDPNQQAKSATTAGSLGSGNRTVDDLLMRYVRLGA